MNNFIANFSTSDYEKIDNYVLNISQEINYGNKDNWFLDFREGLHGFYSRLSGVKIHYDNLHAWLPFPNIHYTEYHLSSCFFNMDSSLECLTYAINTLGYAMYPKDFRDITNNGDLKRITPKDIIGYINPCNPKDLPPIGYSKYFPNLMELWKKNEILINSIIEQHDVSKHRKTIFSGGQCRLDVPDNFYESLGIPDDVVIRSQYRPMAEIILKNDPKKPNIKRQPQKVEEFKYFENMMLEFEKFIKETSDCILQDIQKIKINIK